MLQPKPLPPPQPIELTPPDVVETNTHACRCGHVSWAHEHYRRGTDCALCACPRYRGGMLRRGLRHERYGVA